VGKNTNEPTGHPHSQFFLYFIVSSFSSLSERNFSLKSPDKLIVSSFFFQLYKAIIIMFFLSRSLGFACSLSRSLVLLVQ